MRRYLITLLIASATFVLAGCSLDQKNVSQKPSVEDNKTASDAEPTSEAAILNKITAEQAKEMIDSTSELIILDVRTPEEFNEGHIENAILIPDYELESKAEEILTDKSTTLLVYCRSGRRSALASQILSDLGYSSIYDFGGIIDWPYEVVTTPTS